MARKRVVRRRTPVIDDEPIFENEEISEEEKNEALGWYHYNQIPYKKLREYYIEYAKGIDPEIAPAIRAAISVVTPTWGSVARMFSRGLEDESLKTRLDGHIVETVTQGNIILAEKGETQPEKKGYVPNIQERIRAQVGLLVGEIEFEVDEFLVDGCKSKFNLFKWLQKKEVKGAHASRIKNYYAQVVSELDDAIAGNDDDLAEGYSFLTKPKLKKYRKFINELVNDAETFGSLAKANRKPRKRKVKSVRDVTSKVKYKVKDDDYKIVSVDPSSLVDASQVWLFNTKDRFLHKYTSTRGMVVKGTTLYDWDETASFKKKIRKPEKVLPDVVSGGKVKLRKLMDGIRAKESKVTGRIGKDIVIVRVVQ